MVDLNKLLHPLRRVFARWKAGRELNLVSDPGLSPDGPIAFGVLRNEILRLPRYLDYYRSLGIRQFVIVENNSTDGTREFLSSQRDVILYSTAHHFIGKAPWLDFLFHRHAVGRWCLVADADELLAYPSSDSVPLAQLCSYLEHAGSNAVHAVLLDLYPDCALKDVAYRAGDDYMRTDWYFDPPASFTKVPRHFHRGTGLDFRFHGGVRNRLFGLSVCCSKFPLFRFRPGMYLTDGQHYLECAHFSGLRAVIYHFKYLHDFDAHAREEVRRGQHIGAGAEYRAYAETLAREGDGFRIKNEASLRLAGTDQLEKLGIVVRPPDYDAFLRRSHRT
jgi:hypothetical protein